MAKESGIESFSMADLETMRARGASRSNLEMVRAKTEADLDRDIAGDPEFRDVPQDWHAAAEAVMPAAKQPLSLRLDADVVEWFREQGAGYQTRINAVLRAYVTQQKKPNAGRTA
jgi:uncharacterized protein (DUF4415 family)